MCRRQTPGRERERERERERVGDRYRKRKREREGEGEGEGGGLERLLLALYYQPCTRACAQILYTSERFLRE